MTRAGARPAARKPRKANKRGAARLAAVQALYQMDLAGTGLNEILAEFQSHWLGGDVEGAQYRPAETAFFSDIVHGVVREQTRLDPQIDAALARGWPSNASRPFCARCSGPAPTSLPAAATCRRGW
jgi:N utilization substance protein B